MANSITLSRDELGHIIKSAVEMALAKFGVRADEWEPVLPIVDDIDFKDNKKWSATGDKDDLDDEFVPVFEVKTDLNAVPKLPRTVKDLNEWSRAIVIFGKQMKNKAYHEVLLHDGYVKWLMEHRSQIQDPCMKNLAAFVWAVKNGKYIDHDGKEVHVDKSTLTSDSQ